MTDDQIEQAAEEERLLGEDMAMEKAREEAGKEAREAARQCHTAKTFEKRNFFEWSDFDGNYYDEGVE